MKGQTVSDFARRVTVHGAALASAVALAAGWLAGPTALVGVGVGAAVALVSFRWLARAAASAVEAPASGRARSLALVTLRHLGSFLMLGAPVAAGVAHPVALAVGLTVLPVVLTTVGLLAAREEA